jgi:hypothetical protein
MKKCLGCNLEKDLTSFYKNNKLFDGHFNKCKECIKANVRKNYARNREYYKNYEKNRNRNSFYRIFLHRYGCLKQRCGGMFRKYKVSGTEFLDKKTFLEWCFEDNNIAKFKKIHSDWEKSNYDHKLSPSIDRIDNNKGYTIDNIQWLTKSQNSKKYIFTNERL